MKIRPIRYHPANSPLPPPTRERPPPLRQRFLSGGLPTRRQPKPGRYDLDSGPPSERRKVKPPRAWVIFAVIPTPPNRHSGESRNLGV